LIDKLKTLLKVKKLKEAEALKQLQMKRVKEREAKAAAERSRVIVEESAATLEPRSDALYAEIMNRIIDLGDLDDLKLRLIAIQKDHDRLKDRLQRDEVAHEKADSALNDAIRNHDEKVRATQKYEILTDDLAGGLIRKLEFAEEAEIEDRVTKGARPE
jgi:Type III secretion protein YscO